MQGICQSPQRALSDLAGLTSNLTEQRRDEISFVRLGNVGHHLPVDLTLIYIVITAEMKIVTLHVNYIGQMYDLVKTFLFSVRLRGYRDHLKTNCIRIDFSKPKFERKLRRDYVITFPESKLYVFSLKQNAILINYKLYN